MVSGASQVITDAPLAFANIHALLSPASLSKLAAAAAIVVSLYFGLRRFKNPLVLVGLILAGIAAAHSWRICHLYLPEPNHAQL
jgi:hypothetical protein